MLDRRSFLKRILPATAGVIVVPTLAETLAVSAKKYFFLKSNPLSAIHGLEVYYVNRTFLSRPSLMNAFKLTNISNLRIDNYKEKWIFVDQISRPEI